jgi:hypothetical protein
VTRAEYLDDNLFIAAKTRDIVLTDFELFIEVSLKTGEQFRFRVDFLCKNML